MTVNTDQLVSHFGQVQKTLMTCPKINIVEIHGQPPDNYEIEYNVNGYSRSEDGSVQVTDNHRIHINLPFGYPHFPPVVKPLTPIFHPDIDPDAIRIADFWQREPSLAKLIIHIGEMICGRQYSLDDPFNQEAADWYGQHKDELPLDEISFTKQPEVADEAIAETIQALDDSLGDLSLEEPAEEPAAETGKNEEKEPPPPDKKEKDERLETLYQAIEEKRFFAASHLLAQILETTYIPECKELEQTINTAIRETDRLFKSAEHLESQGELDQALMQIDTLIGITSDFPGIEDVRRRIHQAQALSGSLQNRGKSGRRRRKTAQHAAAGRKERREGQAAGKRKAFSLKLVAILTFLLLAAGVGIKVVSERQELRVAETYIKQVEDLVEAGQFRKAQELLERALSAVSSVQILLPQKKKILRKVVAVRENRDFSEGIKGRVRYGEEYVSKELVPLRQQLDSLLGKAEELQQNGNVSEALSAYDKAVAFAEEHSLPLADKDRIEQARTELETEAAVQMARDAEADQDWTGAAEAYQRALALSRGNEKLAGEVKQRLQHVAFQQKFAAATEAMEAADWQKARDLVAELQNILEKKGVQVTVQQQEELSYLRLQTILNDELGKAKTAYEEDRLQDSIRAYEKALTLLREGRQSFPDKISAASVEKLEKTLLMVKIAEQQNQAGAAEQDGDLQGAIEHYRRVLDLIANGPFQKEEALQTLARNTRLQIIAKTNQLVLDNKISWLLENYASLFLENYPSAAGSELSDPQAKFLRKQDGKLIFKISCREQGQGSPSRLELEYQFDPETGIWSLYTGQ